MFILEIKINLKYWCFFGSKNDQNSDNFDQFQKGENVLYGTYLQF